MATDWAQEQLDAYNDIQEDGASVRVISSTGGTYNPITEAVSSAGTAGTDTYAIITTVKDEDDVKVGLYKSEPTNVKKGDKVFLVPAYNLYDIVEPAANQEFTIKVGSKTYRIIAVDSIEPGGVPVLYRVYGRR